MSTVYYRDKPQTTTTDTGSDVRVVADGEVLEAAVLNRPSINLKNRTDEIARYLEKLRVERLLDSSRRLAVVEVDNNGGVENPAMVQILKQGTTYFAIPGNLSDPNNANSYRLQVTSGVENAGCYSISREALHGFYTDGAQSGYAASKGLSSVTDTISLAVPRYKDTVISASSKDIVASASEARPLMEATYVNDYALNISSVVSETTGNALIKTPSLNRVKLGLSSTHEATPPFKALLAAGVDDLSVSITKQLVTTNYTLDTKYIEILEDSVYLYLESFASIESAVASADTLVFTSSNASSSSYTFDVVGGDVTVSTENGVSPPFDFIIPLFYMTGDRIVVSGMGSVLISEVDRLSALGATIMLRGDGKVETNLIGGQVDYLRTQNMCVVELVGTSTLHDFSIPLYNDLSLENSYYELEKIEVVDVVKPVSNLYVEIAVRDGADAVLASVFNPLWLTLDLVPKGAEISIPEYTGRDDKKPEPGDHLVVRIAHSAIGTLVDTVSGVILRLSYVKVLQY
jgi:hypothetical protein